MSAGTKWNGSEITINANVSRAHTYNTVSGGRSSVLFLSLVSAAVSNVVKKFSIKSNAINYNQVNFVSFGGEFSSGNNWSNYEICAAWAPCACIGSMLWTHRVYPHRMLMVDQFTGRKNLNKWLKRFQCTSEDAGVHRHFNQMDTVTM